MTIRRPLPDSRAHIEERQAKRTTRFLIGGGLVVMAALVLILIFGLV